MGRTVIFLDVDGVLNSYGCPDRIGHIIGVEDEKVSYLKEIANYLNADIVLSSTWRKYWNKELLTDGRKTCKGRSPYRYGRYLNFKLQKYGLVIADKTEDIHWRYRATEIAAYLKKHPDIDRFIILDDEDFYWDRAGIGKHWVNTYRWDAIGFEEGLTQDIVDYIKNNVEKFKC